MIEFFLITLSLSGFAVAQPLFDILSKTPEFLVIRKASLLDIIFMTVVLTFGIPIVSALLRTILGPLRILYDFLVYAILCAAFGLLIFHDVYISMIIGPGGALLIQRSLPLRKFVKFLSIAPPFFACLFLFSIFQSTFATSGIGYTGHIEDKSSLRPTFVVIFDEFPLFILLNKQDQINAARFPGFNDLARNSTWFRNASAITSWTERAVPLILSGALPDVENKQLPALKDYPQNIFTLFSKTHRVQGFEQVTSLCPSRICPEVIVREAFSKRIRILFEDLLVIYAHRISDPYFKIDLPPVEGKWGNFIRHADETPRKRKSRKGLDIKKDRGDDVSLFRAFLENIRTEVPALLDQEIVPLYVIHITFPHVPYRYLPDGRRYFLDRDINNDREFVSQWAGDAEGISAIAMQRLAMQTAVADTLVKEFLDTLRDMKILEQSAFIVTADHGSSFRPGEFSRKVSLVNYSDILSVPFFMRLPIEKRAGEINDYNVTSLDILPTLLESNGIAPESALPGSSLLNQTFDDRKDKKFYPLEGSKEILSFPAHLDRSASVERYVKLYGEGGFDDRFYQGAFIHQDMIGKPFQKEDPLFDAQLSVAIHNGDRYKKLKLSSQYLPVGINGFVRAKQGGELANRRHTVALVLEGKITAITQTEFPRKGQADFLAIAPPNVFTDGENEIQGAVFKE